MRNLTKLAPDLSRTWKMDVRAIGDHLLINDASGWWACRRGPPSARGGARRPVGPY